MEILHTCEMHTWFQKLDIDITNIPIDQHVYPCMLQTFAVGGLVFLSGFARSIWECVLRALVEEFSGFQA